MRISLRIILAVLLVAIVSSSTSANTADVILNTLGPGNSYDATSGQSLFQGSIGGQGLNRGVSLSFIPTTSTALGQVLVAVNVPTGASIIVSVAPNFDFTPFGGTDGPSNTALESFNVAGISSPELVDLTSVLNPALGAGQKYWVEIQAGPSLFVSEPGTWFNNNQGIIGEVASYNTFVRLGAPLGPDVAEITAPAVEILSTTPTPEPATLGMFAAGAALVGLLKRKRLRN